MNVCFANVDCKMNDESLSVLLLVTLKVADNSNISSNINNNYRNRGV